MYNHTAIDLIMVLLFMICLCLIIVTVIYFNQSGIEKTMFKSRVDRMRENRKKSKKEDT